MLFGAALVAVALAERWVARLPLTPALLYLVAGWCAAALFDAPIAPRLFSDAHTVRLVTEVVVLVSLLAVALRLRVPPTPGAWRVAWLLAVPGMVVTIVLAGVVAHAVIGLPWAAALLLATLLAPTDPVLASEVQVRSEQDRDAVRLSLSAEGGVNDGTALPTVLFGLALVGGAGIDPVEDAPWAWLWQHLVWPIGGGALLGGAIGVLVGRALRQRLARGDEVHRDELLYVGLVMLCAGVALAVEVSTFVIMFAAGATLVPAMLREPAIAPGAKDLLARLRAFGSRIERLLEAVVVLLIGASLQGMPMQPRHWLFGLLLVLLVRPLAVFAVVRAHAMSAHQRRLVAWFGIRGVGSVYYLALALEMGIGGTLALELTSATLAAVALSILLHGVSATPLMETYRRRKPAPGKG